MIRERLLLRLSRVIERLIPHEDIFGGRGYREMMFLESADCCGTIEERDAYITRVELACSWPIRAVRRRVQNAKMSNYRFLRRALRPHMRDFW